MFRLSVKQDYPDLCGLWLEAFGEGEESAKFVFEGFSSCWKNCHLRRMWI